MATNRTTKPQAPQPAGPDGMTEVTLVRGTFHERDAEGNPLTYGPGKTVKVGAEDLAMLQRLGFVPTGDEAAPEVVQDGSLKIETADGPTVTAG